MSAALSFNSTRFSWLSSIFRTPRCSSSFSSPTAACASLTLSFLESLYRSHTALISFCNLPTRCSTLSLLSLSLTMACTFWMSPKATLSGQSSCTQAANSRSSSPRVTNHTPQSQASLSLSPSLDLRNLALETMSLASSLRGVVTAGLEQVRRMSGREQRATTRAARLMQQYLKIIEKEALLYNLIVMLQEEKQIIQSRPRTQLSPHQKRTHFLSQYESHDSESPASSIRRIRPAKFMRRLRQLWNQQRYLTDDELDSSRDHKAPPDDSSMDPEPTPPPHPHSSSDPSRHRPRQLSSSDDNLNRIRKSTQLEPPLPIPADGPLSQIEAFNSEIENQLSD